MGRVVSIDEVRQARHLKCYLNDGQAPQSDEQAEVLIAQRGFMALGKIPRDNLPNMSETHESSGWAVSDKAWGWKETLPARKACAYLKWFHNQGTFISWEVYPWFYSIWGIKSTTEDAYYAGLLSRPEAAVLKTLAENGSMSSRELWCRLKPQFGKRTVFISCMARLQKAFCVAVSGGDTTGWSMHHWSLVRDCVPEGLLDWLPSPEDAMKRLLLKAAETIPYCTVKEVASLFRWAPSFVLDVASDMRRRGELCLNCRVEGSSSPCLTPAIAF